MEPKYDSPVNNFSSSAVGCHRLPQILSMGRNVRTAQSKTSAKQNLETQPRDEEAVLHVEGTSRIVKILTDGLSELSELDNKDTTQQAPAAPGVPSSGGCLKLGESPPTKKSPSVVPQRKKLKIASKKEAGVTPSGDHLMETEPSSETIKPCQVFDKINESGHYKSDNYGAQVDSQRVKDGNKKESPLEKKKRASKMGLDKANTERKIMEILHSAKLASEAAASLSPTVQEKTEPVDKATEETETVTATGHIPRCVIILPAEVPTEAQLQKLLGMSSTSYDLQCPPLWMEGDLLWARVSGHPFWPCMVSKCPFSKMIYKVQGDLRVVRSYHVQFFGNEAERGWINEPSLMAFEGKLKFMEKAQTVERAKKGKSQYNPFKVNAARQDAWNVAVEEAEGAVSLSLEDRVVQYSFEYVFLDELKKGKKDKTGKGGEPTGAAVEVGGKKGVKRKRPEDEPQATPAKSKKRKLDVLSPTTLVIPVGTETSFDAYYANHRSLVIEHHPDWETSLVFEYLRQQWELEKKKTSANLKGRNKTPAKSSTPTTSRIIAGNTQLKTPPAKMAKLTSKDKSQVASPTPASEIQLRTSPVKLAKQATGLPLAGASLLKTSPLKLAANETTGQTPADMPPVKTPSSRLAAKQATGENPEDVQTLKTTTVKLEVTQAFEKTPPEVPPVKTPSSRLAAKQAAGKTPAEVLPVKTPPVRLAAKQANGQKSADLPTHKTPPVRLVAKQTSNEEGKAQAGMIQSKVSLVKLAKAATVQTLVDVLPQNTPPGKLTKQASKDSGVGAGLAQTAMEQGSQTLPSKRVRRPKCLSDYEVKMSSSMSCTRDSTDSSGDLCEDSARIKPAAALSARKASQDSDSSTEGKGKGLKENEPYELEIFKLNFTCKIEKDKMCTVCEKNGEVIECTGPCNQSFHLACLGSKQTAASDKYICSECSSGIHTCFSCKKADMETVKCYVNMCGKFYHEDCIRKYRLTRMENKGFICPLHTCATCAVDSVKNLKAVKGRFYRCVRCPTAYHAGDHCVAAGSVNLAGSNIVCSDHFQPNRSLSCHSRLNITWCFSCSKGGTLLCCESCPAAFHAECVKVEKTPEEAWFCVDCAAGKKPLYGNIVWIKVGNYRWWPGEICHPRHVPLNIQEKAHQVGEFPVRFFGSHDYYWIHRGRVFLFQEGDKGSREGSSRGLFKIYMKGVNEATEAFKLWMAAKAKKIEQEQERNDKKPPPYKFVKGNIPIGNVQIYKAELSQIPKCECKPDQEDACTTDCLNRMMMYECHPSVCPAGDKCHNQRFQKRQYPECEPFKSETRGWGLRCLEDIKKGQFVHEYVGDLIDEEECKRRIEQAHEDNITNFYMLTMDKNRIIDAGPKGNLSRFMNHSCCPNLETQKWTVNGDIRVGLFALCDIPKGTEVTFNYNLECLGNEKKACSCGADNCSGFLGVRPKTVPANDKKDSKKKRRKKKLDRRQEHEDDCFRCGEGGELVMCDKSNCPKVYHLQCLKLTKPPLGKWLCPWHHCDECGKLAILRCVECPNSYCAAHSEGNLVKTNDVLICHEHTDLIEGISLSLGVGDMSSGEVKLEVESSDNETVSSDEPTAGPQKEDSVPAPSKISAADSDKQTTAVNGHANVKVTHAIKAAVRNKLRKSSSFHGLESSESAAGDPEIPVTCSSSSIPSGDIAKDPSLGVTANSQKSVRGSKLDISVSPSNGGPKARLTSTKSRKAKSGVSLVNKSIIDVRNSLPAANSPVNESDDTDSISDLVIDIP